MKKLAIMLSALLVGCAGPNMFGKGAGVADYELLPIVTPSGQVICCSAKVYNTKNVGEVTLRIHRLADGTVEASLEEKGVDSVGPVAAAAANQAEMLKLMNTMASKVPVLP